MIILITAIAACLFLIFVILEIAQVKKETKMIMLKTVIVTSMICALVTMFKVVTSTPGDAFAWVLLMIAFYIAGSSAIEAIIEELKQ